MVFETVKIINRRTRTDYHELKCLVRWMSLVTLEVRRTYGSCIMFLMRLKFKFKNNLGENYSKSENNTRDDSSKQLARFV